MRRRKSCFEKRLLIREDSVLGKESSIERKVLSGKGTATKGEESLIRKRECFLVLPRKTKKNKKNKSTDPMPDTGT